jgi:hypothetical protein
MIGLAVVLMAPASSPVSRKQALIAMQAVRSGIVNTMLVSLVLADMGD